MLFAETETSLFKDIVIAISAFANTALTGVLSYFMLKLQMQKQTMIVMENRQHTDTKLRNQAIDSMTETANMHLATKGEPPIIPLKDVIPQSQSPPSDQQKYEAGVATAVAQLTAARLAVGLPALTVDDNGSGETKGGKP